MSSVVWCVHAVTVSPWMLLSRAVLMCWWRICFMSSSLPCTPMFAAELWSNIALSTQSSTVSAGLIESAQNVWRWCNNALQTIIAANILVSNELSLKLYLFNVCVRSSVHAWYAPLLSRAYSLLVITRSQHPKSLLSATRNRTLASICAQRVWHHKHRQGLQVDVA